MPLPLEIQGVHAEFRDRGVLHDVTLSVRPGARMCLLGPNGAGKSTLLRVVARTLRPSSGRVWVLGKNVWGPGRSVCSDIGYAHGEARGLIPQLSGRANLAFYAALYGLSSRAGNERVQELADAFEAGPLLDRPTQMLSTGERGRLSLMRALLHRPRLLLLDELTRVWDPGAAQRLWVELSRILADETACFWVTHDLYEAARIASDVVVLDQGQVKALGTYPNVRPVLERVFGVGATP